MSKKMNKYKVSITYSGIVEAPTQGHARDLVVLQIVTNKLKAKLTIKRLKL